MACDLPAGRKVGGFLGHSAHLGCSRCLKCFVGRLGEMDYSGFECKSWPPRTGKRHREDAETLLACNTKMELEGSESKFGCRYSVLLRLPYFDAPRMLIVDHMHNLFLGSGKHFLKAVWLEREMISSGDCAVIQDRVDRFVVLSDIDHIPHKIFPGFASFTADQFKNWIVHFSVIALRDTLAPNDLECWRHFVLDCFVVES